MTQKDNVSSICECVEELTDKVKQDVEKRLGRVVDGSLKVEFQNKSFLMPDFRPVIGLPISIQYRRIKTDGTPYRNLTKEVASFKPSYCCFCGRSLASESKKG